VRVALAALAEGLRAPLSRAGLALPLWLARLLPAVAAVGLPLFDAARERSAHHPDAGLLLDPSRDASGFAYAWLDDFGRAALEGASDTLFWLVVVGWLLVTFLAGGVVARLLAAEGERPPLLPECGRFAGRFFRLALLVLALAYVADVWLNAFLAKAHAREVRAEHLEDLKVQRSLARSTLFVAILYLLGLVHAYARIDLVRRDGRSATAALVRGFGTLFLRLPSLLVVETGMLFASGAAILLAWIVTQKALAPHSGAGFATLGLWLGACALFDYLRTGLEVGAMAARCRLLGPPPPSPPSPAPSGAGLRDLLPPLPAPKP
jgi:hypothetical protein